jgi:hypothetical protein
MCWTNGAACARLQVDLRTGEHMIETSGGNPQHSFQLLQVAVPLTA